MMPVSGPQVRPADGQEADMQFRERRKVIQLIRTVYDPSIKRGRAELVGRLDKTAPVLDDELRTALSEEEVAEVDAYLARRTHSISRESTRMAAQARAGHMRQAEAFFAGPEGPEGAKPAAEIFAAWEDLKKALHRAGYRKNKKPGHHGG
jgi:hypothetical protein